MNSTVLLSSVLVLLVFLLVWLLQATDTLGPLLAWLGAHALPRV